MTLLKGQYYDLKLGERGEKLFQKYFKNNYDNKIVKTRAMYEEYDFDIYDEDEKIGYWELKTRRVKSDTYTSLMFGLNKLVKLEQKQKDLNCRVYFLCYDKLMYWECYDIRGKQNKEWFIKRKVFLPTRGTYGDCVCVRKEYLKEETNTINSSMCMNTIEKKKSLRTIKEQEEKMKAFYEQQRKEADCLFLTDSEDEC